MNKGVGPNALLAGGGAIEPGYEVGVRATRAS